MRKELKQYQLVGALTSKPYSFKSRPWELKTLESIDLQDSLGSNIKINYRGSDILRVIPNLNEAINEEWISDRARFSYDSLNRWRFNSPLIKNRTSGVYEEKSWQEAFKSIKVLIKDKQIKTGWGVLGPYLSLETLTAIKSTFDQIPQFGYSSKFKEINSSTYNLYSGLTATQEVLTVNKKQVLLLVGTNLRLENPILNLRLRKLSKKSNTLIGYIGPAYASTVYCHHLGASLNILKSIVTGKSWFNILSNQFYQSRDTEFSFVKKIHVWFGTEFFNQSNAKVLNLLRGKKVNQVELSISFIYNYLGYLNADVVHFSHDRLPFQSKQNTLFYMFGNETFPRALKSNDLAIFQGHHQDRMRHSFEAILPTLTFFEKDETFINCLKIKQKTSALPSVFDQSKKDWQIVKLFAKYVLNHTLTVPTKELSEQTGVQKLSKVSLYTYLVKNVNHFCYQWNKSLLKSRSTNYYLDSAFLRASKLMNQCSTEFTNNKYIYIWK